MPSRKISLETLPPAVGKPWLTRTAGGMWVSVGIMLNVIASRWLRAFSSLTAAELVAAGMGLAAPIYFFGFSRLARKNIVRISMLDGPRVSLFAFQTGRSYPLVASMIALGLYLRLYSPVPKPLLAILYIGIGGALFAAGLHYFGELRRLLPAGDKRNPP